MIIRSTLTLSKMSGDSFGLLNKYIKRFHLKSDRMSVFAFDKLEAKVKRLGIGDLHLDAFTHLSLEVSCEVEDVIEDLISYSDLDILTKRDLENLSSLLSSGRSGNRKEIASEDLRKMIWTLWENTTPFPFWTSDNPIVVQSQGSNASTSRHSIIYFPLNPRLCLVLYGRSLELNLMGKARNRNLYRVLGDQESFVKQQNSLQLSLCERMVFSNVDDFRYARRLVESNRIL